MKAGIQAQYIEDYSFPEIAIKKFRKDHPNLRNDDVEKVALGLKQFFYAYHYNQNSKDGLMMPSHIVDQLWHHFMLDSAQYYDFCQKAFGRVLHHSPGLNSHGNKSLHLLKKYPQSLYNTYNGVKDMDDKKYFLAGIPILFALDSELHIINGFYYNQKVLNNIELAMKANLTSNNESTGSCGGTVPIGTISSSDSSSDSGGCGGGCGGD